MRHVLKLLILAFVIASCAEPQVVEPVSDNRADIVTRDGSDACLELIYPVSLKYGDALIVIESESEWVSFWEEWVPGERDGKPGLVYPVEVRFKGELLVAESEAAMTALKNKCGGDASDVQCFRIVYPISLELPDGSIVEVSSEEEWHEVVKNWNDNNPDSAKKPIIVFPIDVIIGDRLVTIESEELFAELKERCKDGEDDRIRCFSLIYPLTIILPDGTTVEVESAVEWQEVLREWYANNGESDVRPQLQYPVQVRLRDGEVLTIDSEEEMMRLKQKCAGDETGGRVRERIDARN